MSTGHEVVSRMEVQEAESPYFGFIQEYTCGASRSTYYHENHVHSSSIVQQHLNYLCHEKPVLAEHRCYI